MSRKVRVANSAWVRIEADITAWAGADALLSIAGIKAASDASGLNLD